MQLAGTTPTPATEAAAASSGGGLAPTPAPPRLPGPSVTPFPPPGGGGPPPKPGPGPKPKPPGAVPFLELGVSAVSGPLGLGAAAGLGDGSCTAVAAEPSARGCIAEPRQDPGMHAEASGQVLPQPIVISVP